MPAILNLHELHRYLQMAEDEFGDPSKPTFLLCVPYSEDAPLSMEFGATYYRAHQEIALVVGANRMPLELAINLEDAVLDGDGSLIQFHIRKASSGVWALSPLLHIPGVLHAFIVIHGVPDPAPWERLILLPGEVR